MRQWLVNPKIMCRNHLLGEHLEVHMFIGAILEGKKVKGFLDNNLLEPLSLFDRHEKLVKEMIRRGYNHKSPIDVEVFASIKKILPEEYLSKKIDRSKSLQELISRCNVCKENYEKQKGEI